MVLAKWPRTRGSQRAAHLHVCVCVCVVRTCTVASLEEFVACLTEYCGGEDPLFYAIIPTTGESAGKAVGVASLMRVDPENGAIEVGHIHFAPVLRYVDMRCFVVLTSLCSTPLPMRLWRARTHTSHPRQAHPCSLGGHLPSLALHL